MHDHAVGKARADSDDRWKATRSEGWRRRLRFWKCPVEALLVCLIVFAFNQFYACRKKPEWVPERNYRIIDAHTHIIFFLPFQHNAANVRRKAEIFVEEMDRWGIARAALLSVPERYFQETGNLKAFDFQNAACFAARDAYPQRFDVLPALDYRQFKSAGWTQSAIAQIEDFKKKGAVGIKEYIGNARTVVAMNRALGLDFAHMFLTDKKLSPVFEAEGKSGGFVLIHLGDIEHAPNLINRKIPQYPSEADFNSVNGKTFDAFEEAAESHPEVNFVIAHLAGLALDPDRLAGILDRHENVYSDLSGIVLVPLQAGVSKDAASKLRGFIIEHQDRIVFGTDWGPLQKPYLYKLWRQWLERPEGEAFRVSEHPGLDLYALGLPEEVLEKVYHLNYEKLTGRKE